MNMNYIPTKLKVINEALRLCGKPGFASLDIQKFELDQINLFYDDAIQEALDRTEWYFNRDVTELNSNDDDLAISHNFDPSYIKYGPLPDGVMRILTPIFDVDNNYNTFDNFTRDAQGALWVMGGSPKIRVTVLYDVSVADDLFYGKLMDNRLLFVSYAGLCLMRRVADAIIGTPGAGKQLWDVHVMDVERKMDSHGRQQSYYQLKDPT